MTRLSLVLWLILLSVLSGCVSQPTGSEYFWYSDGSRRTYDVKAIAPLLGVIQGTAICRVDGTATIDGRTYQKTVTSFEGFPGLEPVVSYVRLGGDGIYSRKSTDSASSESLDIPLPPENGRKWTTKQDNFTYEMQIAAIEDVDTAERTYEKCIKVTGRGKSETGETSVTSFYAPHVGLVKMSLVGPTPGVSMEFKLRNQ